MLLTVAVAVTVTGIVAVAVTVTGIVAVEVTVTGIVAVEVTVTGTVAVEVTVTVTASTSSSCCDSDFHTSCIHGRSHYHGLTVTVTANIVAELL